MDESLSVDEAICEIIFRDPKPKNKNKIISLSDQLIAILKKA